MMLDKNSGPLQATGPDKILGQRKHQNKQMKGGKGGLSGIIGAMMPGAHVDKKGRISLDIAMSSETVIFNVGGIKFETYKKTLHKQPNSPLANEEFLQKHFRADKGEYFFDRDPDVFKSVLNYLRTSELHLPSYVCGPAAKNELEFWGVDDRIIEKCCWTNYNDWNSTLEALDQFEIDRTGFHVTREDTTGAKTKFQKIRPRVWATLNVPSYSLIAKIYGYISIGFVFLSIFSFLAETTETFQYYQQRIVNGNSSTSPTLVLNGSRDNNVSFDITTSSSVNYEKIDVKHPSLEVIDIICLVFFTVEYIVRIFFAPRKLKFIVSPMGVIDLLAILPDFIEYIVYAARPDLRSDSSAVDFISIMRVIRVLRIFRLISHVPGLWILVYTLKASFSELILLLVFILVGMLIFASVIYFVEEREHFKSIPDGFWWALITMTTVGYGDMYPMTPLGKVIGSFCALSGLLMIGFSVPALVNNFMLYYKHMQFALAQDEEIKRRAKELKHHGAQKRGPHSFSGFGTSGREPHENGDSSGNNNISKHSKDCVPLVAITELRGDSENEIEEENVIRS